MEFEKFLIEADIALRSGAEERVCLPYWRWKDPFPGAWLNDFLPASDPAINQPVPARRLASPPQKPSQQDVLLIVDQFKDQLPGQTNLNDYLRFTYALEGWGSRPNGSSLPSHNHVHDWVGGIMSNTSKSPTDPIFWIHHCEVDRLWYIWRRRNSLNGASHPPLQGADRIMDPWSENYAELIDPDVLGYKYNSLEP